MKAKKQILFFALAVICLACGQKKKNSEQTDNDPKGQTEITEQNSSSYFKATGTEPFWALEIKAGKIHFNPMEGTHISTSLPGAEKTGNQTRYHAASENGMLHVVLTKENCQNGMSGEWFTHRVSVTFKNTEMEKSKTYTGCGSYTDKEKTTAAAQKLEGKWILQQVNGKSVSKEGMVKTPSLEIRLVEGKAMGNAGCNQYSGEVKLLGEKLSFARVVSTKMACPNMEVEDKFMSALIDQPLAFQVKSGQLILSNSNNRLLFKKE